MLRLAPPAEEEGRKGNQSRRHSSAREKRRQTTSRNTNTCTDITILAVENVWQGEFPYHKERGMDCQARG